MSINHFDPKTLPEVKEALNKAQAKNCIVRIFQGNQDTGEVWPEENDIIGKIGNSTGSQKVALLVPKGEIGGGAILTACVLGVRIVKTGEWLYKHPKFNTGLFITNPTPATDEHAKEYPFTVYHNGNVHARFKTDAEAGGFCEFMSGNTDTLKPSKKDNEKLKELQALQDLQNKVKELLQDLAERSPELVEKLHRAGTGCVEAHENNSKDWLTPRAVAQAIMEDKPIVWKSKRTKGVNAEIENYKLFL